MKFVRYQDLKALGIPFSRVHVDRLQKAGQFPKKIKLGLNTAVYSQTEVEQYLASRLAARNEKPETT